MIAFVEDGVNYSAVECEDVFVRIYLDDNDTDDARLIVYAGDQPVFPEPLKSVEVAGVHISDDLIEYDVARNMMPGDQRIYTLSGYVNGTDRLMDKDISLDDFKEVKGEVLKKYFGQRSGPVSVSDVFHVAGVGWIGDLYCYLVFKYTFDCGVVKYVRYTWNSQIRRLDFSPSIDVPDEVPETIWFYGDYEMGPKLRTDTPYLQALNGHAVVRPYSLHIYLLEFIWKKNLKRVKVPKKLTATYTIVRKGEVIGQDDRTYEITKSGAPIYGYQDTFNEQEPHDKWYYFISSEPFTVKVHDPYWHEREGWWDKEPSGMKADDYTGDAAKLDYYFPKSHVFYYTTFHFDDRERYASASSSDIYTADAALQDMIDSVPVVNENNVKYAIADVSYRDNYKSDYKLLNYHTNPIRDIVLLLFYSAWEKQNDTGKYDELELEP